jgi:hypothetical protein
MSFLEVSCTQLYSISTLVKGLISNAFVCTISKLQANNENPVLINLFNCPKPQPYMATQSDITDTPNFKPIGDGIIMTAPTDKICILRIKCSPRCCQNICLDSKTSPKEVALKIICLFKNKSKYLPNLAILSHIIKEKVDKMINSYLQKANLTMESRNGFNSASIHSEYKSATHNYSSTQNKSISCENSQSNKIGEIAIKAIGNTINNKLKGNYWNILANQM